MAQEEKKKKRVVTRIGDIFCIEYATWKAYFQFIAVDHAELSSPTIRVFKKRYPLDYEFNAEEVVSGEVMYYAHTMLQTGLKQNAWTKVGKSKDIGDLSHILFRRTQPLPNPLESLKSYWWSVGGINQRGQTPNTFSFETNGRSIIMPAHHEVLAHDVDLKRLGGVLATAYESRPEGRG